MRQVTEVVRERLSVEDARTRSYIEWQTRALASFLAANSMSEKGAQELQKAAQGLTMYATDDDPHSPDVHPGEDVASLVRAGSFEKLSGMFG